MKENKNFQQEKEWLLREKYGVKSESELGGGKSEAFSADLTKLKNGEPLAYIIGNVSFLNCKIDLSFYPLIPRSETEFWVNDFIEEKMKKWNLPKANSTSPTKIKILDIFSGSGCVGISILKNSEVLPRCLAEVDFGEVNPLFIKQIKKNISLNLDKEKKYNIYQSDVFEKIPKEKKYHYILANPPYIPKNKKIDSSVKNFEDYNSLFALDNGLYFIKKIILNGLALLYENGKIYIEFDENSKEEIENFLKEKKIQNYQFKKDQFNNWRILIIEKKI